MGGEIGGLGAGVGRLAAGEEIERF